MSTALRGDAERLRRAVSGTVRAPGDDGYDAARQVWNADADRSPALVVRPLDERDVCATVRFAAAEGLPVVVRGGGHGLPGYGTADGAVVLDLAQLRELDVRDGVLTVGGGQVWGAVDAVTQARGAAVTGADSPHVGVGGTVLGGGFGWLHRWAGLTCDNLLDARLVTADATVRTVSARSEPELFWALRGGGAGLGVATRFRFRLHPLRDLSGGTVMYPIDRGPEVLAGYQRLCRSAPPELALRLTLMPAPPAPFVPPEHRGRPVIMLGAVACGPPEPAARMLASVRELGGALVDSIRPMSYVELQQPPGRSHERSRAFGSSAYLGPLDDGVIGPLLDAAADPPGPLTMIQIQHLGGAIADVAPQDTAFSHRDATHHLSLNALAAADDTDRDLVTWTTATRAAIDGRVTGGPYVNFTTGAESPAEIAGIFHPTTRARLLAIKEQHDPGRLFAGCVDLRPAARSGGC